MKNKNMNSLIFKSALLCSAAAAFAANDSTASLQQSMVDKLDSMNKAVLGMRINGNAQAGGYTSMITSDQLRADAPSQENQAYTNVNLNVVAQPSAETRATVKLRLHKDWQSAIDENNDPIVGHWFSYDGTILNKHVDFNLGYMRVGYTPLTINTPQTQILQEPEIFTEGRVQALDFRNLDTTSRRLMQGLNAAYHSGAVGPMDNIYAQVTGARMRNTAKKNDQVFFDFDWADRYSISGRAGAEAFGARLGANYVNIFDRKLSTRSRELGNKDTIVYDDNSVLSLELGFDSKKLLPDLPANLSFGLNGEFAMSWWKADMDYLAPTISYLYEVVEGPYPNKEQMLDSIVYVSHSVNVTGSDRKTAKVGEDDGMAFNVQPYVKGEAAGVKFDLNLMYLQNDETFWSDLASAPSYLGSTVILNANAKYTGVEDGVLAAFSSGSLENLYFSVLNANILNASNLMTSGSATVLSKPASESGAIYYRLYNNYKLGQFFRNAYSATALKRMEAKEALLLLDPAVNMAMPYGLATPDRKGFAANLDLAWNEAVSVNVRFSSYDMQSMDNKYMTLGAGIGVDIGRIVPSLDRQILIQGSYEMATESALLERSTQRIVAGLTADIWGPIGLQAGVQMLTREFGGANGGLLLGSSAVTKAEEMLLLAGPKVKIASASYLTVRYGMLTNSVDFNIAGTPGKLSIDKNIISGEVTVNF